MNFHKYEQGQSRRHFIKNTLMAATGLLLSSPIPSWATAKPRQRSLFMYNTHTDEELKFFYAGNKSYDPVLLQKLNHFLRDHRTGDVHAIDPRLLDILYNVQRVSGHRGVFEVISGYRSPKTNALLRRKSHGVAKHSLHLEGRAIDIRMSGVRTRELRDIALELKRGGVGYYAKSDFVHLDTGRFRTW